MKVLHQAEIAAIMETVLTGRLRVRLRDYPTRELQVQARLGLVWFTIAAFDMEGTGSDHG